MPVIESPRGGAPWVWPVNHRGASIILKLQSESETGVLTMRIERLPGTTNVLRFPVERRARPTLELLREIAPDVDEVLASAEVCDLDGPVPDHLRARVDAETAQHILDHFGGGGAMPHGFLDELLDPVVAAAVTACHAAHDLRIDRR